MKRFKIEKDDLFINLACFIAIINTYTLNKHIAFYLLALYLFALSYFTKGGEK